MCKMLLMVTLNCVMKQHADVQNALDGYIELCEEATRMHDSILVLLPEGEKEKDEICVMLLHYIMKRTLEQTNFEG